MTTKSLEAKDVLTSEGWLLLETSREGSPSPFDEPQRVLLSLSLSLWIVLFLSMVFVQPYYGVYPQVIFCAGVGDGSCNRSQSVCLCSFRYKLNCISPYTLVVVESRKIACCLLQPS